MNIASQTPEGQPNQCPLCGNRVLVEPSHPTHDAPCPHCGHLLYFVRSAKSSSDAFFFSSRYEADKVPPHMFGLVPLSVSVENEVIPVDKIGDLLVVASIASLSRDVRDKLQFILHCEVQDVLVSPKTFESLRQRQLESA